jgi:hypothetical protein
VILDSGHCAAAVGAAPVEVVVIVAIVAIVNDWTWETRSSMMGLSGVAESCCAGA